MSIPAAVPATHRWLYYAINYGHLQNQCAFTLGPQENAMQGNESLMNRGFYWCDALGGASGGAPFNPLAKTPSGANSSDGTPITLTGRWKGEVLDVLDGTDPKVNRPTLVQPNILGIRSADDTWPGGAALTAWTPGGPNNTSITQYVEDCVLRWADLMSHVPYAIPYRMWHEMGNAATSYGDGAMKANNWQTFRQNWRKIVTYFRTLGICVDDASGKPNFMTTKAFITWCPAGHADSPGSDVEKFPHTDIVNQKDGCKWVHIISRDPYTKAGQSVAGAGQAWVDEFHPDIGDGDGHGPSNALGRPMTASEAGNEPADSQSVAKTQEIIDRLTGNHADSWKCISAWLWWNASSTAIPQSGQMTTILKNALATAYFIPNGIATEPSGGVVVVTAPVLTSSPATNITASSATLNGTVDPNNGATTYRAEWGPTAAYGTQTQLLNAGSGDVAVPVTIDVTGLPAGSVIHWRLIASNSAGAAVPTTDRQFTTDTVTVTKPIVTQSAADGITQTAAVVHGTVNPNGKATLYHVEYGLTTAYGLVTPDVGAGSGTSPVAATVSLSSLTPGATYHTRITATNSDGTNVTGDAQFTTQSPPPVGTPAVIGMGFVG